MGVPSTYNAIPSDSFTARMLAAATDERKPNIYGGMLSQYDADQVSQPVEFSGPQGYGAQSGHRGTYPTSDRGHGMTMGHYSDHQFMPHGYPDHSRPMYPQNHSPMSDQLQFQQYLTLDTASYTLPQPSPSPGPYPSGLGRMQSLQHAFPGDPSVVHDARMASMGSYPSENLLGSSEHPEGQMGQPLPDPGEYLRQKLGLKPGDPVNLWSLSDPEPGQRPTHSYPLLVRLAIYGSPNQRMTLKQIYAAIEERFEWYRKQPKNAAWRGSIRHNLSLNQVFRNVHRPITEPGKGNYWEIDHSKGEGYKRERKRKPRKGSSTSGMQDDDDEDEQQDDYCVTDPEERGLMTDSDCSGSFPSPSGSQSSLHRGTTSRSKRRSSPYPSRALSGSPPGRTTGFPSHRVGQGGMPDMSQRGSGSGSSESPSPPHGSPSFGSRHGYSYGP